MSPPSSLFMCRKAEESQMLFRWPLPSVTETDLMPNPVAVDSERDAGKSKKQEGLWEPKSERLPNRNSNRRFIDVRVSCIADFAASTEGVGQNAW